MAPRIITLDPVTRIEGHLRLDVEVNEGQVSRAWSSAQMWRGIELLLKGRPPEDAWALTQRLCGVCTTVHAIASIRSVEHALQVEVPLNAQFIRNILIAQHAVQAHLVHFYHLTALDWVDLVAALRAQAMVALGLLDDPAASGRQPDRDLAKYLIDTLGVLETKTRGNLTEEEKAFLDAALFELRMAFLRM